MRHCLRCQIVRELLHVTHRPHSFQNKTTLPTLSLVRQPYKHHSFLHHGKQCTEQPRLAPAASPSAGHSASCRTRCAIYTRLAKQLSGQQPAILHYTLICLLASSQFIFQQQVANSTVCFCLQTALCRSCCASTCKAKCWAPADSIGQQATSFQHYGQTKTAFST